MRLRSFSYTTLGQLRSAANPESAETKNTYYGSGNLWTREDARQVITTYTYDELNRLLGKSYSANGNTPPAAYEYYVSGAPDIGQLKSVSNSVSHTTYNNYDELGRVSSTTQTIYGSPQQAYSFGYKWWLTDELKEMQYPSGKIVRVGLDNAGRANRVSRVDLAGAVLHVYADLPAIETPYAPDGRIAKNPELRLR